MNNKDKSQNKEVDPIDEFFLDISGFGDKQLYDENTKQESEEFEEKRSFPKEMIEEYLNRVKQKNQIHKKEK